MPNEAINPTLAPMLSIHFQPILSLRTRSMIGIEALVRHTPLQPPVLSPLQLFSHAQAQGTTLQLDRACRRQAMLSYRRFSETLDPKPLLFFNFESSVIDQGVEGSGAILEALAEAGLDATDVVIEINESRVKDTGALRRFVDRHRQQGFLIALDDLGAGDSNLPRIAELRPQILKLDRDLVQGIEQDFFKQETFKSLVSLGHRIGALILAEGVETQAEVDCCAALGAELFQGFYFSKAVPPEQLQPSALAPGLAVAAQRHREQSVQAIQRRRFEAQRLRRVSEAGSKLLAQSDPTGFDIVLKRLVSGNLAVECAYLLNRDGIQVTDTITHAGLQGHKDRLFAPAPRGTDHSSKEYFFSLLDAGLERYTTETYLSMATGQLCRTVACLVPRPDGSKYVLCLDLHVDA